ncbi:hypothetical protein B7463_g11401, partial [Scytalidium lignicola]
MSTVAEACRNHINATPQHSKAVHAEALVSQRSEPLSSNDDESGLRNSDSDLNSNDDDLDKYSLNIDPYMAVTRCPGLVTDGDPMAQLVPDTVLQATTAHSSKTNLNQIYIVTHSQASHVFRWFLRVSYKAARLCILIFEDGISNHLQARDAADLPRKDRRDDGNNDNNNDNNRSSTQTSTSTRLGTSTTLTTPTSAVVASTTSLLSPTSSTLPASISAIPEIPSSFTSKSSLPFATTLATSTPSASSSSTPSRTTVIVPYVVAAGAGASVFVLLLFCIYKSLFRRRKPTDISTDPPTTNTLGTAHPAIFARPQRIRSQDSSSRIWGSSQSGSTTVDEIPPCVPAMMYNMANNSLDREERLGLVRNSLLRLQDRNGPLIRSQSQARGQSETLDECRGNEYSAKGLKGDWKGLRMSERDRVDIEAGGQWEAPITIAACDSRIDSVVSMPRWRDPVTWVKDQVERNRR